MYSDLISLQLPNVFVCLNSFNIILLTRIADITNYPHTKGNILSHVIPNNTSVFLKSLTSVLQGNVCGVDIKQTIYYIANVIQV